MHRSPCCRLCHWIGCNLSQVTGRIWDGNDLDEDPQKGPSPPLFTSHPESSALKFYKIRSVSQSTTFPRRRRRGGNPRTCFVFVCRAPGLDGAFSTRFHFLPPQTGLRSEFPLSPHTRPPLGGSRSPRLLETGTERKKKVSPAECPVCSAGLGPPNPTTTGVGGGPASLIHPKRIPVSLRDNRLTFAAANGPGGHPGPQRAARTRVQPGPPCRAPCPWPLVKKKNNSPNSRKTKCVLFLLPPSFKTPLLFSFGKKKKKTRMAQLRVVEPE